MYSYLQCIYLLHKSGFFHPRSLTISQAENLKPSVENTWNLNFRSENGLCCPALELFHCLPLWKTGFFLFSIGVDNEKALELDNNPFSDLNFKFQVFFTLGFRLFTRASKKQNKMSKKVSKNLWLMSRLYLLVAYPVWATQLFGLFQFILHPIFWEGNII